MKTLRQICAVSVLTIMLALSTFAGDMSTTVASPIQNGITTINPTTEVVLNLIQSVLALF